MADEISFQEHISTLFREQDILCMKTQGNFDLSDYNDVKLWSQAIYDQLESKSMPKDGAYWTEAQLALFKNWMEGGMKP